MNPPEVLEADPLRGPVEGGTEVSFFGKDFENKDITCTFGSKNVTGRFISRTRITCVAPPQALPGYQPLKVMYTGDAFASKAFSFKYYSNPVILGTDNTCGPTVGYTQFTVKGENFQEFVFGAGKCVFNDTIWMNATVIDS